MATLSRNGILTFSRGDTVSFPLFINVGTKTSPIRYKLTSKDNLYVGIMEPNFSFEAAVVKQRYTVDDLNEDGDVVFKLKYKETQLLRPGKYYYEVKLAHLNDNNEVETITTIIPKTQLYVEGDMNEFIPPMMPIFEDDSSSSNNGSSNNNQ